MKFGRLSCKVPVGGGGSFYQWLSLLRVFEQNPGASFIPSKVAHQIEDKQDDQHEAKSAATASGTTIGISAAAAEKDEENNKEN
jgi:hypothetical protein